MKRGKGKIFVFKIETIREVREEDVDQYLKEQIETCGFRFDPKRVKEGSLDIWEDDFGYTKATTSIQIVRIY